MSRWNKLILNFILILILILIFIINICLLYLGVQYNDNFIYYLATGALLFTFLFVFLVSWQFKQYKNLESNNKFLQLEIKTITDNSTALREKLTYEIQVLGIHNEKMSLLIELSDIIQACNNFTEAIKAIAPKCSKILHFADGTLYITNPLTNLLDIVVRWGEPVQQLASINHDQCWALRRGGIYHVKSPQSDLICGHISNPVKTSPYLCIPLMAQNSIFGMLHLDLPANTVSLTNENQLLVSAVTETLALALANISLRESLKNQSLHDSLTGLYNRRYLNEFLSKEMTSASRNQSKLAIFMLDLDYFKCFNDTHGHEAGDILLRELGKLFQNEFRSTDFICRYGGEEFLCILQNCDLKEAVKRAESLRLKISKLSLFCKNKKLDGITASIGISIYPDNGNSMLELISAADKALYQAKRTKNKVEIYSANTPNFPGEK